MKKLFVFSFFCCFVLQSKGQLVVGGATTTSGKDFFCSLTLTGPDTTTFRCGASLITPEWVLTAGHCVMDPSTLAPLSQMDVLIHPYERTNLSGVERIRSSVIVHHSAFSLFVGNLEYDLASSSFLARL